MAQRSSNDILDDILNTLSFIIQEQRTYQSKILKEVKDIRKAKNNSNHNINNDQDSQLSTIELLLGTSQISKNQQNHSNSNNNITSLNDIIKSLNNLNKIDPKKIKNLNSALGKIIKTANTISINKEQAQGLSSVSNFLRSLAGIDFLTTRSYIFIRSGILNHLSKQLVNLAKSIQLTGQQAQNQRYVKDFIKNMGLLMNVIKEIPDNLSKGISKKSAQRIADFFSILINNLPNDKDAVQKGKTLVLLSDAISKMNVSAMIGLAMGSIFIGKRTGKAIYEFINQLLKITEKHSDKDIKALGVFFKELSNTVLKITASIAALALIVTLFPTETIIKSIGIISIVTLGMVGVSILLSLHEGKLSKGIKGIEAIGKSVLLMTVAISSMALITKLTDKQTIADSVGIILLLTITMTGVAMLLSTNKRMLTRGIEGIKTIATSILLITAAIGLITLLVANANINDVLTGLSIVIGTVTVMVGLTVLLSKIDKDNMEAARNTMYALTGILTVVSLVTLLIFPKIADNSEDILKGSLVIGGIILGMVAITYAISKIDEKSLHNANMTMITLTGILVIVALTAQYILAPLGDQWEQAAKGAVVVLGIIGLMGLITFGLSKIEGKDLKHATITMAALTIMLVIISLTVDKLLIPIGKQWANAAKGGTVVLGIIGIMSLIVLGLSKIKKDNLREGVIALAAITIIFGAITLITDKYLIPIGKQWANAAKGGTVILGIIAGMGAIIVAVNRYLKENNIKKSIISLGIMTTLLAVVSIITQKYLIPIGKKGKDALKGGVLVEGIIAGMSLIVIGVTKLLAKTSTSELIKGGLVIAGIGGLLWVLTKTLTPYIKLSILAANNKMNILTGGLMIAGILTAWGLLMTGVGALVSNPIVPIVMAIGGATIAGISLIIFGVTKALTPYVTLSKLLVKEKQYITSGGKLVTKVLSEFKDIIVSVGSLTSFKDGFNMAIGTAAIADISLVMFGLSKGLIPFIKTIDMIKKNNITQSTVKQFKDIVIGQKTGLYETLKEVIDKLSDVGIISLMKAKFIAGRLKPIFDTISKFFEIIKNACNLNYVSEWDKDGKPIAYKSITMPMLKQAAGVISKAFEQFLVSLAVGVQALSKTSMITLFWLSKSISPVMNSVSTFTDSILKVISASIPCEWDKDGKPIKFRQFQPAEFQKAAIVITDAFATFLETMTPRLQGISKIAGMVVLQLRAGIGPVMSSVATYTDAILKLINGQQITYTDERTGQEVTKWIPFNPAKFKKGANDIADCFFNFIDTMYNRFKAQNYTEHNYKVDTHWFKKDTITDNAKQKNHITDLISGMQGIEQIISQVDNYLNLIAKVGEKSAKINIRKVSDTISQSYTNFVSIILNRFGNQTTYKLIEQAINSVNASSKIIKQFTSIFDNLADMYKDDAENANKGVASIKKIINEFINAKYLKSLTYLHNVLVNHVQPAIYDLSKITDGFANLRVNGQNINAARAYRNAKYISDILITITNAIKEYKTVSNNKLTFGNITHLTNVIKTSMYNVNKSYNHFYNSFRKVDKKIVNELSVYSHTVLNTAKVTDSFTVAIKKLDKALITKEQERNKVFTKLKQNIGSIADEINKVNASLRENQKLQLESYKMVQKSLITSTQQQYNSPEPSILSGNNKTNHNSQLRNTLAGNVIGDNNRAIHSSQSIEDVAERLALSVTNAFESFLNKNIEIQVMYQGQSNANYGKIKMRH